MDRRHDLLALALFATFIAGCDSMQTMLQGMDRPGASLKNVEIANLDLQGADLVFDVELSNPYPAAIPLLDMSYQLASGGKQVLQGDAKLNATVPAKGSRRVKLPVKLAFADLLDAVSGVKPGEVVDYSAALDLAVDVPGAGRMTLPIKHDGKVPIPAVPKVSVEKLAWEKLSPTEAKGVASISITNSNAFPVELRNMNYALELGGERVAESSIASAIEFQQGRAERIAVPVSLAPMKLGLGLINMLSGDSAGYEIGGDMILGTPYGSINAPFHYGGEADTSK